MVGRQKGSEAVTDDDDIVFPNVPDGTILPIQVTRVYADDPITTTASDIVALFRALNEKM